MNDRRSAAGARPADRLARGATWAVVALLLSACAGLEHANPDHRLCDEARAQARRGDTPGALATIGRMKDLREQWHCQNVHLRRDWGDEPNSI
jgi:hypothetical protein